MRIRVFPTVSPASTRLELASFGRPVGLTDAPRVAQEIRSVAEVLCLTMQAPATVPPDSHRHQSRRGDQKQVRHFCHKRLATGRYLRPQPLLQPSTPFCCSVFPRPSTTLRWIWDQGLTTFQILQVMS